jgi:hypothetical protein
MTTSIKIAISILALAAVALPTSARADWNEAVNGEFSDNWLTPTLVPLNLGNNIITASTNSSNRDYFRIVLPAGQRLSQIVLQTYTNATNLSFLGMQNGTTFVDPSMATAGVLNGYTHFGTAMLSTDILDDMGSTARPQPPIGFTPPLPAGSYAFWANETAASTSNYSFNFIVTAVPPPAVPALPQPWLPAAAALGLVAAGALVLRARFRRP